MKTFAIVLVILTGSLALHSQPAIDTEIQAVIDEMAMAYHRHDRALFDRFHPRLQIIFGDGATFDRETLVKMIEADSLRTPTVVTSDVKMISYGNFAYVTLVEDIRAVAKHGGVIPDYRGRYSKVFVKEKGKWLLLAEHITDLPPQRKRMPVAATLLAEYAGTYTGPGQTKFTLTAHEADLRVEGQPAVLLPFEPDKFYIEGAPITVQFLKSASKVTHFILRRGNEENMVFERN